MKILAGQFKNHAIQLSQKFEYRPTTSIARKSMFDTLKSLEGKHFLDLYSGSGIIGFEASSRGAESVTFVELDKKHMNQIIANAKTIPYDHFNFLVRDVHRFLKKFVQYDIIFADPPYHIPNIDKLNPGGVFVLECSKKESIAGYNKISKFGGTNLLYWQV